MPGKYSLLRILCEFAPTTTYAEMCAALSSGQSAWLEKERQRMAAMLGHGESSTTGEGLTNGESSANGEDSTTDEDQANGEGSANGEAGSHLSGASPREMLVAGCDEVGRGPAAGPLVAAAVCFSRVPWIPGLKDSKQLSHEERVAMVPWIRAQARAAQVAEIAVEDLNAGGTILAHSLEAMRRAVLALGVPLRRVLIDGNAVIPDFPLEQEALVKGDNRSLSIAAASVLAKVHRDLIMIEADKNWPQYGFAQHKGYCTAVHRQALQEFGPCPIHRLRYVTVQRVLEQR